MWGASWDRAKQISTGDREVRERTHHDAAEENAERGLLLVVTGTIALGLARSAPVAGQDDADTEAKIENAMSAAPSSVSANATILDNELDDAGKFVVLREGSNGWYCFPDVLGTPGPDPQCLDQTWLDWLVCVRCRRRAEHDGAGVGLHAAGRQRCQQHRSLCHRAGSGRGVGELTAARHDHPAGGNRPDRLLDRSRTPVGPRSCGPEPPTSTS